MVSLAPLLVVCPRYGISRASAGAPHVFVLISLARLLVACRRYGISCAFACVQRVIVLISLARLLVHNTSSFCYLSRVRLWHDVNKGISPYF
jgi:hypothetical protein